MFFSRLVSQRERLFDVSAALRNPAGRCLQKRLGIATAHPVDPQLRRARKRDQTDAIVRRQFARQHAERLLHDAHPILALHRTGVVEQTNQVDRPSRLTAERGRANGEPDDVAVVRERRPRTLPVKSQRLAGARHPVAIFERVEELLAAHIAWLRQLAGLQTGERGLERHVTHVQREGGKIVFGSDRLRARRVHNGWRGRLGRRRLFLKHFLECLLEAILLPLGQAQPGQPLRALRLGLGCRQFLVGRHLLSLASQ